MNWRYTMFALQPRRLCERIVFREAQQERLLDFGEVDVRFLDDTVERIHFFASRLKYSRWVEVSIVRNQQVETLVRTLLDHFAAMGGIPLLAVFDRPKTVAHHWNKSGEVTEWNPIFAGVALDLGLGIEVCWPQAPQQKGAIENLIGWVKGSFFKQRRFLDEEDMLAQLRGWLREVNTVRPSRATGVIPDVRLAEEQPRLRPLKVRPADLALRIPIVVGATGYVLDDTHLYSMPSDAIGIAGTLFLYRERVRIVVGRFEATHTRLFTPNAISTLPEHRTERVAAVSGKRGKRYLERQHLLELGEPVHTYLTELTHRRPRRWLRDVEDLHALLHRHGAPPLRAAFGARSRAAHFRRRIHRPLPHTQWNRVLSLSNGATAMTSIPLPGDLDLDRFFMRLHLANARRVWRDLIARAEQEQDLSPAAHHPGR